MNKVFSQLQDETDFENALRKIKLKGKELERLPNERRVGCVTVSIQPMKRGAEGLFQKCYNGICNEMNNKIEKLKSELTEFIQSSSMALDKVMWVRLLDGPSMMFIWFEFRMRQFRDADHREDAPHFNSSLREKLRQFKNMFSARHPSKTFRNNKSNTLKLQRLWPQK